MSLPAACRPGSPLAATRSPLVRCSMRYMLLIYSKEVDAPAAEMAAVAERHRALMAETKRRGILVDASPLEPTATATTVRIGDGRPLILDGPFAGTKEQLAGYYILDCPDLD